MANLVLAIANLLYDKIEIIIIEMRCCSDESKENQFDPRSTFKQKKESQPFKFKVLSMLGLKQYLIDKFVFSRSEPNYSIYQQNGEKRIKIQHELIQSPLYEKEITLIENQNHSIYAVSLNLINRDKYEGTVIYSHGNSSDLSQSLSFVSKFSAHYPKFDYIVYDYTGYGKSNKKTITQQTICQDLDLLIQNINAEPDQIILWGFSLGTYPTVKSATKKKYKGVILQSPLASIYSLFTQNLTPYSTFNNDCFNILEMIGKIDSFLVIFHSKDDEIVPFDHSRVLFERHRMTSSNPFCFLIQLTLLKHNHMHAMLGDRDKNKVRDVMHNYLNLMLESQNLPKGMQFQIDKGKYLEDIGKHDLVEIVDVESKEIKSDRPLEESQMRQSINFSKMKADVVFQMDDITPEETIDMSLEMQVNSKRFKQYFEESRQLRDETEVSEIFGERHLDPLNE